MKKKILLLYLLAVTFFVHAQNVGIGTTTPLARLHVTDSSVLFTAAGYIPGTPGNPPVSGEGRRMMWYPDKGAFRAGYVSSANWDKDSIGIFSVALGFNNIAKGQASFAAGQNSSATGLFSISMGLQTIAKGNSSVAIGQETIASGTIAMAMGYRSSADGVYSTAMGYSTTASGEISTAMGLLTKASGRYSTAMGNSTIAKGYSSTVTGMYNDSILATNELFVSPTTPLFIIGNGSDISTRSNAVTVLKNGRTGIGTSLPLARLHVTDSSVLFSSPGYPVGAGNPPPLQGPGRRMMWYVDKAAFRVGAVDGTVWDHDSIGNYSFASGFNTKAKGSTSVAMGVDNRATGISSTAIGFNNNATGAIAFAAGGSNLASGQYSVAMGASTIASADYSTTLGNSTIASGYSSTALGGLNIATGFYSTAMGYSTKASGYASTSMGISAKAKSDFSLVAGKYNDTTGTNRLFEIGNGTADNARSNAFTVLNDGSTGIGTVNPGSKLHVAYNSSGYTGGNVLGMTLETNTNSYLNILSPNSNETGVLFGKASDYASGGIVYNNIAHLNGLEFRTNGNATRMVLLDNGNLGVGVTDPVFRLDVGDRMRLRSSPGLSAGMWLNNDDNTVSPAFAGMKANDEVGFYGQTGTAGWRFYINTTTGNGWMQGTLTQTSDARLKKDISPLQNPLQKIIRLNGYTYHWKNENSDNRLQTGVLAQEVQKLFPELVVENKDGILAVNYSGLIPVLIESVKEQQKQIDELKKLVQQLLNK
jgi:hypothetical protein